MTLTETIDQDIKAAMLAKDNTRLRGLRAIKSALLLARTEKGAGAVLDEAAETSILQRLVKQRRESAEIYEQQNREDLRQVELEEIEVIESYLPAQLEPAAVEAIIRRIIQTTGASGVKDMGKVMGVASKELAGKSDNKTIAAIIKSELS